MFGTWLILIDKKGWTCVVETHLFILGGISARRPCKYIHLHIQDRVGGYVFLPPFSERTRIPAQ